MKKWLLIVAGMLIIFTSALAVYARPGEVLNTENFDPSQVLLVKLQQLEKSIMDSGKLAKELDTKLSTMEIKKRESELVATSLIRTFTSRGGARQSSFLSLDLNTPSNLTTAQFDKMLEGTPLYESGWIFEKAEREIGVNGLFLMALTGQEQAFGAANTGLKDKFNLTSWNAADGKEHLATSFESYWHCIEVTAKGLKKNYLTVGGIYYNGPNLRGVNVRYASDSKWASAIASIMESRLKRLKN